jgi:monoamine oxidase
MRSRPSSFMAQMEDKVDVIVIGAGVAGLAAACALSAKGISLRIFEARDRIGGRIFTLQDPDLDAPIELGAEFIHGRPPEIWNLLREGQIPVTEVDGDSWCFQDGHLSPCDSSPKLTTFSTTWMRENQTNPFRTTCSGVVRGHRKGRSSTR